jgi:hypothetical protein
MCDGALTEKSLLDLLGRKSKHRESFNHDFNYDVRHHRRGGNVK